MNSGYTENPFIKHAGNFDVHQALQAAGAGYSHRN